MLFSCPVLGRVFTTKNYQLEREGRLEDKLQMNIRRISRIKHKYKLIITTLQRERKEGELEGGQDGVGGTHGGLGRRRGQDPVCLGDSGITERIEGANSVHTLKIGVMGEKMNAQ